MAATTPSQYETAMQSAIEKLYQARSAEDFQAAANTFDRIGQKEADKWHPKYYRAYAQVMMGAQTTEGEQIDKFLDLALENVNAAKALEENNSEILALEGFIHMLRIPVDPATRGPQYSGMSMGALQQAVALDPNNPRAHMLISDMQFGTARFFGSDTSEACASLEKAIELFESFEPKHALDPMWGAAWAEQKKGQCE